MPVALNTNRLRAQVSRAADAIVSTIITS